MMVPFTARANLWANPDFPDAVGPVIIKDVCFFIILPDYTNLSPDFQHFAPGVNFQIEHFISDDKIPTVQLRKNERN